MAKVDLLAEDPLGARLRERMGPAAMAVRVPAEWADGETWVVVDLGRLRGHGGIVTPDLFRAAIIGPLARTRAAAIRAALSAGT
jgi:hypothetical protein